MEKSSNSPKKHLVKFNNVVIFEHIDKSVSIEFAIHLHRSSNIPHTISVGNTEDTFVELFTR